MKCPHCYRELKTIMEVCPGCGKPLKGAKLAPPELEPPVGNCKLLARLFLMPWRFFTALHDLNLQRKNFVLLGVLVLVGLASTTLWWGLLPIRRHSVTTTAVLAPIVALVVSALILAMVFRLLQFYFGEETGILRTFLALMIVFSAFHLLKFVMVWSQMTGSNPFRFIVSLWSFKITERTIRPSSFHALYTISTISSIVIWVFLIFQLTFMAMRLSAFKPFAALFVGIFAAVIYYVLFHFILILMGEGLWGIEFYYKGYFLKTL